MGQKAYNQRAGIEVMYFKCRRSVDDHYADDIQATNVLPSVSFFLLLGKTLLKDHKFCI